MERRRIKFPVMVAGAKNMNGHIYTKESCNSVMEDINHRGVLIFNNLEPVGTVVKSYFVGDVLFAEGSLLNLGLDSKDLIIVLIFSIVIIVVNTLKEKGFDIRKSIADKHIAIRWILYLLLILAVLIFGAYGVGYIPVDPMYANY